MTAAIIDGRIDVSPRSFGAGPIRLIVTNQTDAAQALTFETESGGDAGHHADDRPDHPAGTATLEVDVREGDYAISTEDGGIQPANVKVGEPRPSAQDHLLLALIRRERAASRTPHIGQPSGNEQASLIVRGGRRWDGSHRQPDSSPPRSPPCPTPSNSPAPTSPNCARSSPPPRSPASPTTRPTRPTCARRWSRPSVAYTAAAVSEIASFRAQISGPQVG